MEELLKSWGLYQPEIIQSMKDNEVDLQTLPLLEEEDIKLLIPKIGLRRKFMRGWQERYKTVAISPFSASAVELLDPDESSFCMPTVFLSDVASTGTASTESISGEDVAGQHPHLRLELDSPTTPFEAPPLKRQNAVMFDTLQILSETESGRDVIKAVQTDKLLTKRNRHTMVTILVGHLLTHYGPNPGSFEKSSLAQSVCRAFPCLKDPDGVTGYEAYYMKGARGRPATGYLEEHLRYVRKTLKYKKPPVSEEDTSSEAITVTVEVTSDLQEKIAWMKSNSGPRHTVKDFMAATFNIRKEWIGGSTHSLAEVIEEFPKILDPLMITQDFTKLFKDVKMEFIEEWPNYSDNIIEYASLMQINWKSQLDIDVDEGCLTREEKDNLALLLLPLMFGTRSKTKRGGRSAKSDHAASFIELKLEHTHVPSYLLGIDSSSRPQPFILGLYANSKLAPSQVFVILERHAIEVKSLSEGVDICYKAHYVFNLEYQHHCHGVWQFIDSNIYGKIDSKNLPAAVRAFRAFMSNTASSHGLPPS